jgi:hypothetical protein
VTDGQLKAIRRHQLAKKEKEIEKKEPIYFDTGHTLLNLVVGGGTKAGYGMGYPVGICRDHGSSGASKSFKATELIAANYYKYKDKFRWRYCDPENGNTIDSMTLYGFNMFPPATKDDRPVVTAEDFDYDLNKWLDTLKPEEGEVGIYVLDSLDSLSSVDTENRKEERRNAYDKDKEFKDGTYGMSQAKFFSQEFFRGLTAKLEAKNALLYIVSQERDNVGGGMYAPKFTVAGGRAVTFYETVRLRSVVKQKEEVKDRVVSVVIEAIAEKTRHPYPFRKCYVTIHFTYGIDSLADELDFLFDFRTPTGELKKSKAGNVTAVWDDGVAPMTREELLKYIPENKLRKELKQRVINKWEEIEESIKVVRPAKYGVDDE